mmetsp:Transcript_26248/g.65736  ORF Transcript_26248/g.65736 Transcript_26248/m.65736 type:complete len:508 (+) Transcript_26248:1491-3014(+)
MTEYYACFSIIFGHLLLTAQAWLCVRVRDDSHPPHWMWGTAHPVVCQTHTTRVSLRHEAGRGRCHHVGFAASLHIMEHSPGAAPPPPSPGGIPPPSPGSPGMIGFPSGPLGRSLVCDRSCMISSGGRPNACISWRSVTILAKSFSPSSKARTMPTTLTSCASYRATSSADRVFRFFLIHGGYFFEISTMGSYNVSLDSRFCSMLSIISCMPPPAPPPIASIICCIMFASAPGAPAGGAPPAPAAPRDCPLSAASVSCSCAACCESSPSCGIPANIRDMCADSSSPNGSPAPCPPIAAYGFPPPPNGLPPPNIPAYGLKAPAPAAAAAAAPAFLAPPPPFFFLGGRPMDPIPAGLLIASWVGAAAAAFAAVLPLSFFGGSPMDPIPAGAPVLLALAVPAPALAREGRPVAPMPAGGFPAPPPPPPPPTSFFFLPPFLVGPAPRGSKAFGFFPALPPSWKSPRASSSNDSKFLSMCARRCGRNRICRVCSPSARPAETSLACEVHRPTR